MQIIISRLKAFWRWLADARYIWLSASLIVPALVISLLLNTSEQVIRITGLILQILGILTVIWGICETRALFGHQSITVKIKSWLKRFPIHRKKNVTSTGEGSIASFTTSNSRGHAVDNPGQNPNIEDRVESLEKNIRLIHERISLIEKHMDEEFRNIADALKKEESTRHMEHNLLYKKLEMTGTGGVHISAIGASWLLLGVILSTAAREIANLL